MLRGQKARELEPCGSDGGNSTLDQWHWRDERAVLEFASGIIRVLPAP